MSTDVPQFVKDFFENDVRGNWINWVTIDADGYMKGHSEHPSCEQGDWYSDDVTILIDNYDTWDHPSKLIWGKGDV